MPDWQELLRQRLTGLELDSAESAEVIEELAGHLEDQYHVCFRMAFPKKVQSIAS